MNNLNRKISFWEKSSIHNENHRKKTDFGRRRFSRLHYGVQAVVDEVFVHLGLSGPADGGGRRAGFAACGMEFAPDFGTERGMAVLPRHLSHGRERRPNRRVRSAGDHDARAENVGQ